MGLPKKNDSSGGYCFLASNLARNDWSFFFSGPFCENIGDLKAEKIRQKKGILFLQQSQLALVATLR